MISFSVLLIILLGHAYFNMNRKIITNRLFLWIIGLIWLALTLDIVSVLLNNPNFKQFIVLHKLVNIIGYIVSPCILYVGHIFNREWFNRYHREKIKVNCILLLPLFINGIATLLSHNESGLFYITSNNIYERGTLFFILPCVSYFYFVYNLYFMYKQRKKFAERELVIFSLFYIVPALFTILQLINSNYFTIWSSAAIVIVITYIFILNDQSHRDSLTGLENHLSYEHYAQNIDDKKHNKLFMIYIDLDDFKSINDQYGHCEGDEAIKAFANLLFDNFYLTQKKLIRLGGDEFLILLEQRQSEKVLVYMQDLIQRVEDYNNKAQKPYKLKFSYGMVCYTDDYKNIYQLFDQADKMMYLQKQSRRSKV